jgi:hypothetical protein
MFYCSVWQLHDFYISVSLKNCLKWLPSSWSHASHADCTSEFCWRNWIPRILSVFLKCEDYDFTDYPLTFPESKNDTYLFLANAEIYNPRPVRLLCHQKTIWTAIELSVVQLLHSVARKRKVIISLVIVQVYQNWRYNRRDISLWINGLRKNMVPLVLFALVGHHAWALISCNGISWILWVPLSTEMKQTSRLNTRCVENIFKHSPHEGTSSHNSVLPHIYVCRILCEPHVLI